MDPVASYSKVISRGASPNSVKDSSDSIETVATSPELSDAIHDEWDNAASNNDYFGEHVSQDGEMLSELPQMRRQHVTAGYREGLSMSKAQSMQTGFDGGYPLGINLGHRVGQIFGILEGYIACRSVKAIPGVAAALNKLYTKARKELTISELLRGLDDDTLASLSTELPKDVIGKVEWWEGVTYGVVNTWSETIKLLPELDIHDLRYVVEQSKQEEHLLTGQAMGPEITVIPNTAQTLPVQDKTLQAPQPPLPDATSARSEVALVKDPHISVPSATELRTSTLSKPSGNDSIGPSEGWNGKRTTWW